MSFKRLKKRVESAKSKGKAVLRSHRLEFHKVSKDGSGKCDIVPSNESDVVWGRLYHIDVRDEQHLDRYEGLGYGCEKKCVTVELDSETTVCAVTYHATEIDCTLKPYTWYRKHVLVGAKEVCLPPD